AASQAADEKRWVEAFQARQAELFYQAAAAAEAAQAAAAANAKKPKPAAPTGRRGSSGGGNRLGGPCGGLNNRALAFLRPGTGRRRRFRRLQRMRAVGRRARQAALAAGRRHGAGPRPGVRPAAVGSRSSPAHGPALAGHEQGRAGGGHLVLPRAGRSGVTLRLVTAAAAGARAARIELREARADPLRR